MKWNVSVLRRSGECERTEVADFELSEFFNRIASAEGKAWVLSVERVGDVGDSALVEPDGDELVSQLGKRRWRMVRKRARSRRYDGAESRLILACFAFG